jgi:hypothetical protein
VKFGSGRLDGRGVVGGGDGVVRSMASRGGGGGADTERRSLPPGAFKISSAARNIGSDPNGPEMSSRWSRVVAASGSACIKLGRALPGSCGVGEMISKVSLPPLDSPGVEGADSAGVRYLAMKFRALTVETGGNCEDAGPTEPSGCGSRGPLAAVISWMVRDGVHTTNSSCGGAIERSMVAQFGPGMNAGTETIGKMGVSPSG